jgi:hypothetical protein
VIYLLEKPVRVGDIPLPLQPVANRNCNIEKITYRIFSNVLIPWGKVLVALYVVAERGR